MCIRDRLADERFDFFGKTLSGKTGRRPRWQGGFAMVSSVMDETGNRMLAGRGALGDAVGQLYACLLYTSIPPA